MPASQEYVFHPAPQSNEELPATAVLICTYRVSVWIDAYDVSVARDDLIEASYLNRTNERDELWTDIASIGPMHLAITVPARSEAKDVALELLDALFRSRVEFMSATKFGRDGLIGKADFDRVIWKIRSELAANKQEALRDGDAEIVIAARALHLHPEPSGIGPHHWQADCPGTKHALLIQSETNQFGCGYCRRKGGLEELRAFVLERRAKRGGQGRAF
jgi:hypothetical protein